MLCVDKTGTMIENRMVVADVIGVQRNAALQAAALTCELEPFDPMEGAILAGEMRRAWQLARDHALTREFLAVCHDWQSPTGERRIAIKGAPETVQTPLRTMVGHLASAGCAACDYRHRADRGSIPPFASVARIAGGCCRRGSSGSSGMRLISYCDGTPGWSYQTRNSRCHATDD